MNVTNVSQYQHQCSYSPANENDDATCPLRNVDASNVSDALKTLYRKQVDDKPTLVSGRTTRSSVENFANRSSERIKQANDLGAGGELPCLYSDTMDKVENCLFEGNKSDIHAVKDLETTMANLDRKLAV